MNLSKTFAAMEIAIPFSFYDKILSDNHFKFDREDT